MKPLPVRTIAHYRILEPIGAGGMGAVYKAYDNKLQRTVAIKLLPPEYVSQQDRRRRFFQEARAASALSHPHILTVYEVGEDEGRPYIAMEYVEGQTLRDKIKNNGLQAQRDSRYRDSDRRRTRPRTRLRNHSSRFETREPDAESRRLREDSRLRTRKTRR